jgi:GNAT superfamily N-acetyltransferase
LKAEDVGHRVVVRRIVGARAGRPVYSDLLGELVELTEHGLVVRTRIGRVEVPGAQIARAKRIPDHRRPSATERLEVIAARGWPAPDTERLGDWWLRAAGGWTSRANSVLAVGDPGLPMAGAVDAVSRWYAARDLPPAITVPLPLGGRVMPVLDRFGWRSAPRVDVCTSPLAPLVGTAAVPPLVGTTALPPLVDADGAVRLDAQPPLAWLAVVAAARGLPPAAGHVLTAVPQVRFAGGYADDGGTAVAIGRGVVVEGWLGIALLNVDPAHRRRGWARRIIGALASWAAGAGAARAYVQVEADNAEAHALYDELGFEVHHGYVTRWFDP